MFFIQYFIIFYSRHFTIVKQNSLWKQNNGTDLEE